LVKEIIKMYIISKKLRCAFKDQTFTDHDIDRKTCRSGEKRGQLRSISEDTYERLVPFIKEKLRVHDENPNVVKRFERFTYEPNDADPVLDELPTLISKDIYDAYMDWCKDHPEVNPLKFCVFAQAFKLYAYFHKNMYPIFCGWKENATHTTIKGTVGKGSVTYFKNIDIVD
jgi:hypothetical protein